MYSWLFVFAIALVVVGVILVQRWMEQKRDAKYQQYCETRGFHYEVKRPGAEEQYATVAKIFTQGHSHEWRDQISGQFDGSPFTAFEYLYTTGSGKSSTTHKLAMIHWQTLGHDLPNFSLAPETLWSQVGEFFGAQDVDFPDDPVFSRGYTLKGTDEAAVRNLFTPSVRQALTTKYCHLAGAGPDLFWWQEERLPPPDEMEVFLAQGDSVRKIFVGD